MLRLSTLLAAIVVVGGPVPVAAAEVSCEGFSPAETACDTTLVPDTERIEVHIAGDLTFVGLISVTLSDADDSITLPCPQASVATSACTGEADGTFDAGTEVAIHVEVFSFDGITPSIGAWSVTASG